MDRRICICRINLQRITPWVERKFVFDLPAWMFPHVVERVRGGPARVQDIIRDVPGPSLTRRAGSSWSIQENIGHLLDMEALWAGRLDDLEQKLPTLRAWEETNRATWEAEHNSRPLQEIIATFRDRRAALVRRLDSLDESLIERSAFHPRLKTPMRTIDLAFFLAEHDDYHLAKITALKKES